MLKIFDTQTQTSNQTSNMLLKNASCAAAFTLNSINYHFYHFPLSTRTSYLLQYNHTTHMSFINYLLHLHHQYTYFQTYQFTTKTINQFQTLSSPRPTIITHTASSTTSKYHHHHQSHHHYTFFQPQQN